ncbi:MAG: lipocalin family protein [Flavobacteriales bacterium]|nr:lipocalin family protein [Flavobacteriales bacterium]
MKNLVAVLALSLLFFSCKSTVKFNYSAQSKMKGDWTISSVEYRGAAGIMVTAFDDADAKCFQGSKWFFVANNNSGNYTLTGSSKCPSGTTQIKWYVTPENYFSMKKVFEGEKAKNIGEGYILKLENQTENSFDLTQDSYLDGGKKVQVVFHFVKS